MKWLRVLSLSAILATAVASISDSSFAQQKLTKDQLVGTWTLVSCGEANNRTPLCVDPNGLHMYDAGGRYMSMIAARGRPKMSGPGNRSAEEYKAAGEWLFAHFGRWSFDETGQKVTLRREGAFNPANEGTDVTFTLSLTGDEVRAVDAGGYVSVWRRTR
jgi:hypothetical protein